MKTKIFLILLGTIILLIEIVHISILNNNLEQVEVKLVEQKKKYPEIYDYLSSVTLNDFQKVIENKKNIVVYVGRPTCGDCNKFDPKFIEMIKRLHIDGKVFYLNVAKIQKDEPEWEKFKKRYGINYTPTIVKYVKGKYLTKVEWTPEKGTVLSEFETWLRKNLEVVDRNENYSSSK
ncbi:putative bacteriocin transport accessory protein [Enterococcus faecalis 13-SD-W-01]|nr:putative bacteriocin transport accessory protein [Enterococcus faecalis 13-SD-W-01]